MPPVKIECEEEISPLRVPHTGWPTVKIKPVLGEATENSPEAAKIKVRIRGDPFYEPYDRTFSSSFIRSISSSPSFLRGVYFKGERRG